MKAINMHEFETAYENIKSLNTLRAVVASGRLKIAKNNAENASINIEINNSMKKQVIK